MPTVADVADDVIGVDTHTDTHTLVLCSPAGVVRGELTIDNTAEGFAEAVAWVSAHASGPQVLFGVEGTRAHGQAFTGFLTHAGFTVAEVERPARAVSARRGKSDLIDARAAAHALLRTDTTKIAAPRADGDREGLRILLVARDGMVDEQKKAASRLRALLLSGTDTDRALLRTATLSQHTLTSLTRRRARRDETLTDRLRRTEITRLAKQVITLHAALRDNRKQLLALVDALAPGLTDHNGVGPISAARIVVAYSHPGRIHSAAAFAALAGACPIPASSGRTNKHRLNRGGDRQLNRALHDITTTRMRDCPTTRAYVQRRTSEGHFTHRDARRALKTYIARSIYRYLERTMTVDNT